MGHAPGEAEVAAEMALGLEEYQQLLGDLKGLEIGTLHMERNEDSGEEELAYMPGRPEEDPLFRCLRGELEERLAEAIQNLPDRERLVMSLYYYEEMTMREIGLALGVVESRVSQVHASAVVHLRGRAQGSGRARGLRPAARAQAGGAGGLGRDQGLRSGRANTGFWITTTVRGWSSDGKDAQTGRDRRALSGGAQLDAGGGQDRGAGARGALQLCLGGRDFNRPVARHLMLNDLFARNLTHNLAAWLRTRFQVNLVSAEQIPFNEFLLRIPEISYVASVRMEPLGALAVLQLDLALAPPIIDLLLGGEGRDGPLRELTDIEESILASVVEIICRELTAAWQPVGLSFNFERRQMQTQVARIMSVTEKTLCLSFEIRMPHSFGPAESGLSGGGGQHDSAPPDLGLGPPPPPCRRDAGADGGHGAPHPLWRQPCSCPRCACRPARSRTWSRARCCAWIWPPTRCRSGGWAANCSARRKPFARERTAPRASSRSVAGGRAMKSYP